MKYLLLLFLSFLSITISNSQTQWWAEQTSGVTTSLTSVSLPNCVSNVWVCGYNGVVLKSSNNGTNWVNVSGNIPNNVQLINICALDCSSAVVAGYLGTNTWVWKTTNSGNNWTQVFTQPNGFIDAIAYKQLNTSKLVMVGDPVGGRWSIWRSTNLGSTWDSTGMFLPQAGTESGYNNSLYWNFVYLPVADSSIWFGTNNSRLYRSTDGGFHWINLSTGSEANTYAVMAMDIDVLIAGATMQRTTNLGVNWSSVTALGTGNFGGMVVFWVPVDNINTFGVSWYVRSDTKIYTGFNGSNWSVQYTAPAGNYRHISTMLHSGPIWAVRDNGGISACTECGVSGIVSLSNNEPADFSLGQNYPNPFNPTTRFEFTIPNRSNVKLCIYNSIGQLMDVLNNGDLNPGTYGVNYDATKLASGVYYYSLIAKDGGAGLFTQTKKMVVVK